MYLIIDSDNMIWWCILLDCLVSEKYDERKYEQNHKADSFVTIGSRDREREKDGIYIGIWSNKTFCTYSEELQILTHTQKEEENKKRICLLFGFLGKSVVNDTEEKREKEEEASEWNHYYEREARRERWW